MHESRRAQATLSGVAIVKHPVSLETLLRSFTRQNYTNITGEVCNEAQITEDMSAAEVRAVSDPANQLPDD